MFRMKVTDKLALLRKCLDIRFSQEFGIYNSTTLHPFYRAANSWQSPAMSAGETLLAMGDPLALLEEAGNTPATAERIVPSLEDVFIHSIEAREGAKP